MSDVRRCTWPIVVPGWTGFGARSTGTSGSAKAGSRLLKAPASPLLRRFDELIEADNAASLAKTTAPWTPWLRFTATPILPIEESSPIGAEAIAFRDSVL